MSYQGGNGEKWVLPPYKSSSVADNPTVADPQDLTNQLQQLKPLCNIQQLNSLCKFLTLDSLEDHPDYSQWTVSESRYQCLVALTGLLTGLLASNSNPTKSIHLDEPNVSKPLLGSLVANGLVSYYQSKPPHPQVIHCDNLTSLAKDLTTTWAFENTVTPRKRYPLILPSSGIVHSQSLLDRHQSQSQPPVKQQPADTASLAVTVPWLQSDNLTHPAPGPAQTFSQPSTATKPAPVSWTVEIGPSTQEGPGTAGSVATIGSTSSGVSARGRKTREGKEAMIQEAFTPHQPPIIQQIPSQSNKVLTKPSPSKAPTPTNNQHTNPNNNPNNNPNSSNNNIMKKEEEQPVAANSLSSSFSHFLLYKTDCPLRCISYLTTSSSSSSSDEEEGEGVYLAIGSNAKSIHVLRFPLHLLSNNAERVTEEIPSIQTLENVHKGSVYCMDYAPTKGLLVSGSNDKFLRITK